MGKFRVAIVQPALIYGGRLRVILGMVQAWNALGITPHVVTANLQVDPEGIASRYEMRPQLQLRRLAVRPRLPGELAILAFNRKLKRVARHYDLLINTGNSLIGFPDNSQVLTYLFFPRKVRVQSDAVSIHQPDVPQRSLSRARIERLLARRIYEQGRVRPNQDIICMTEFTRDALVAGYGLGHDAPVIYPPVHLDSFAMQLPEKKVQVATMGRFVPDKRQLVQIKRAREVPEMPFFIMGFAGNGRYFAKCQEAKRALGAENVQLCPDLPFGDVQTILGASRYFLHTLMAEPFGLTAVQAIAAGCLPIVHDSGGQRETVPLPELRYQDDEEIPVMLRALEAVSEGDRQAKVRFLQGHIRARFDADVFHHLMTAKFEEYL